MNSKLYYVMCDDESKDAYFPDMYTARDYAKAISAECAPCKVSEQRVDVASIQFVAHVYTYRKGARA